MFGVCSRMVASIGHLVWDMFGQLPLQHHAWGMLALCKGYAPTLRFWDCELDKINRCCAHRSSQQQNNWWIVAGSDTQYEYRYSFACCYVVNRYAKAKGTWFIRLPSSCDEFRIHHLPADLNKVWYDESSESATWWEIVKIPLHNRFLGYVMWRRLWVWKG